MLKKGQEGGQKGKPYQGVSPLNIYALKRIERPGRLQPFTAQNIGRGRGEFLGPARLGEALERLVRVGKQAAQKSGRRWTVSMEK